ncbi:MAG: hypothetical protein ABFS46_12500, partial [Myxococcota bacterium]
MKKLNIRVYAARALHSEGHGSYEPRGSTLSGLLEEGEKMTRSLRSTIAAIHLVGALGTPALAVNVGYYDMSSG